VEKGTEIYKMVTGAYDERTKILEDRREWTKSLGITDASAYADGRLYALVHPNFDLDKHEWKSDDRSIPQNLLDLGLGTKAKEPDYYLMPVGSTKLARSTRQKFNSYKFPEDQEDKAAAMVAEKYQKGFWEQCTAVGPGQNHGVRNYKVTFLHLHVKDILMCVVPWEINDRTEVFEPIEGLISMSQERVMQVMSETRKKDEEEDAE
jgi:hypothetical protein